MISVVEADADDLLGTARSAARLEPNGNRPGRSGVVTIVRSAVALLLLALLPTAAGAGGVPALPAGAVMEVERAAHTATLLAGRPGARHGRHPRRRGCARERGAIRPERTGLHRCGCDDERPVGAHGDAAAERARSARRWLRRRGPSAYRRALRPGDRALRADRIADRSPRRRHGDASSRRPRARRRRLRRQPEPRQRRPL